MPQALWVARLSIVEMDRVLLKVRKLSEEATVLLQEIAVRKAAMKPAGR
jgi:hypothetical protein